MPAPGAPFVLTEGLSLVPGRYQGAMDISSRSGGRAATVRAGRGRRRLTILAMVSFLLSLLIQYSVAPVAAVHDEGIFELDGNAVDQAAVAGDDWQNGTPGASDTLFIPGAVEKDGADTSYFKGGGSKDHHDISDWAWPGTDVAPDKDELLDVLAAVYEGDARGSPVSSPCSPRRRPARSSTSAPTSSTIPATPRSATGSSRTTSRR